MNLKKKFDILNSQGTTFGALTKDELFMQKVIIPTPNVIAKFEYYAHNIEKKIRINECQTQKLMSLRNFLIPMLMNGQVTFK